MHEFNRKLGLPITTWSLLLELYKYEPERKNAKIKTNLHLICRFMQRNGYTFRSGIHVGQKINNDA